MLALLLCSLSALAQVVIPFPYGSGPSGGGGFPLTNSVSANNYDILNVRTLQASRVEGYYGAFNTVSAPNGWFNTINAGAGNFNGLNIYGNMYVWSNAYWNTVINVQTTVLAGTITTYVNQVIYTTNMVALYTNVYTNYTIYTTNYYYLDTYVNVGGTFDASLASWVAFPHALYSQSQGVIASNVWNFSNAVVVGLGIGDMVRRTGETNAVDLTQTLVYVTTNSPAPTSVTSRAWVESYMASNIYALGTSLTYYVQKTGETGVIDLSGAQVYVASPTSPSNPVTLAWVLAQGYGTGSGNLTVTNSPADPYSVLYVSGMGSPTTGYWSRLELQHWKEQYRVATNANFTGARLVPTSVTNFSYFGNTYGLFWATNGAFSLRMPDNTITGGQARGLQAVDLQLTPWDTADSDKVAAGSYSFLGAGAGNRAGGQFSAVVGGRKNTVNGDYSAAIAADSTFVGGSYSLCAAGSGWIGGGSRNTILSSQGGIIEANIGNSAIIAADGAYGGYCRIANLAGTRNVIIGSWDAAIYGPQVDSIAGVNTIIGPGGMITNSGYSFIYGGSDRGDTISKSSLSGILQGRYAHGSTNANSRDTLTIAGLSSLISASTNVIIMGGGSPYRRVEWATNVIAIAPTINVISQHNWVVIGNIRFSLNGTNNPPLEGAIAFDNGNWRFAVSNQWRTPLYE